VITKIERRYTLRQFERIARRVNNGGDFPAPIIRMTRSCGKKYN
jgi:hypothetical protein